MFRISIGTTRVIALCLAMLGLVAFAACGGEDAPAPAPTLEVAATATAMPEPTATPPYLTSSIDILKVGMTTSAHESMLPYELPTPRSHIHAVYEAFVGLSEVDGAMIPRLATDWSMSADGTQWIFDVRKGVEFHFGYGEMTSADLRHTWERDTSDEAINADHLTWQGVIAPAEDIDKSEIAVTFKDTVGFVYVGTSPDISDLLTPLTVIAETAVELASALLAAE